MKSIVSHILFTVMTLLSAMSISSCSDDLTDNTSQTSCSKIHVEQMPYTAASRAITTELSTTFEEGDAIGIFALDGTKVVATNVKFTLAHGSWTGAKDIPAMPGRKYYAYYPYVENPYTPDFSKSVKDEIFSGFIIDKDNKFHLTDQSTKDNFTKCDLMLAEGTVSNGSVTFRMEHQKVLAAIGYKTDTYYAYSDNHEELIPLTPNSGTNHPYISDGKGYFLCKPNVETNIWGMDINENKGVCIRESETTLSGTPTLRYEVCTDGVSWQRVSACPSWLTLRETKIDGKTVYMVSTTNEKTTDRLIGSEPSSGSIKLRQAPPITKCRDLSMYKNDGTPRGTRTTANCYLVHAPGKYKLPLIYGNAIKNGKKNTLAYKATIKDKNVQSTLLNHLGNEITDPWIKNNGIDACKSRLLWQETPNLIKNVRIDGDYLTFEVDKNNITESNAVIAVQTQDETIVWSWHIWITPETLSDMTPVNTGQHIYNVAPVDLGWVSPKYMCNVYAGSKCRVIASYPDGNSCYFEITQPNSTVETDEIIGFGGYTYYQWGRKDPIVRSNDEAESLQTIYDSNGQVSFAVASGKNTIPYMISNPMTVSDIADEYQRFNYWDINQNNVGNITTPAIKTVYDPCPPDMVVPTSNLYVHMGNDELPNTGEVDNNIAAPIWNENGKKILFPGRGLADVESGTAFFLEMYMGHSSSLADYKHSVGIVAIGGHWETIYSEFSSIQLPLAVRPVAEE